MRILGVLAILFNLVVGGIVFWATFQLKLVAQVCQPTPEPISARALEEKAKVENDHIEVNQFTFGKPIPELAEDGSWDYVWLPIEPLPFPRPKTKKPPPEKGQEHLIFYRAIVHDQAAVDEILKRTKLEAFYTNDFSDTSRWRVTSATALKRAHPLNAEKSVFLAEPQLQILGQTISLADPRLYDPRYEAMGAWGGGGLILLAFIAIYITMRPTPEEIERENLPPAVAEPLRAQLHSEAVVSRHMARSSGTIFYGLLFTVIAGVLLLTTMGLAMKATEYQQAQKSLFAAFYTLFALLAAFGMFASASKALHFFFFPTEIRTSRSGIRWREGRKQYQILWPELGKARRAITVGRSGGGYDTLTITLRNGRTYIFSDLVITDYLVFAETLKVLVAEDAQMRELSTRMI
jgi:hypothetical protein